MLGALTLIMLLICGWSAWEFASGPPLHESLFHDPRRDFVELSAFLSSFVILYAGKSSFVRRIKLAELPAFKLSFRRQLVERTDHPDPEQVRLGSAMDKIRILIQTSEKNQHLWEIYDRLEAERDLLHSRKAKLQPTNIK